MIITKKVKSKKSKKSSKKTSNPVSKKILNESTFARLQREREEQKAKEKIEQEKAAKEAEKEYNRKCKIVYNYMEKVDKKLKDTIGRGFTVWVDDPKFTKFHMVTEDIEEITTKDPEKYAGRKFANIYINSFHKTHGKEKQFLFDKDAWATCSISVFKINKDGTINRKSGGGMANWVWTTDDFKITKITYKFIKFVMHVIDKGYYDFAFLGGVGLNFMINGMKEKGVRFDNVLEPLAGL